MSTHTPDAGEESLMATRLEQLSQKDAATIVFEGGAILADPRWMKIIIDALRAKEGAA